MFLLGLDIGTSGCKATIIHPEGKVLGQSYKEYFLISNDKGWQEIDPNVVWSSVKEVISEVIHKSEGKGSGIKAISVSSFGEAGVAVDRKGNPLYNSIIYIDSRGQEECEFLKGKLGFHKILEITGVSAQSMYTINKIMWLKQHMPEVYSNAWKFLLFADFILLKLGAKPHTDYSLAARTMAFDVLKKSWSPEIMDCAGVEAEKFGEPVQAGTVVGEVSVQTAKELGLPKGVLLVAGGHDQPCAALGAGVIKTNLAVDGLGTTECITPAFDKPVISESMAKCSFACVPHVIKNMYVTYAFTFTSGSVLKWFRDNFGSEYYKEAKKTGVNIYDFMIRKAIDNTDSNPSDVLLLPHFAGAATPYMDTQSKGTIVGLTINTKAEDILKAILEGITYEMMVNLEKLNEAGVRVDEMRTVGGLAQSDHFLQLKANMMGRKVTTLQISEAGTLGVAILAGTASGVYRSAEEAVNLLVKNKKEFYPDEKIHKLYEEKYFMYKNIYPAVKGI